MAICSSTYSRILSPFHSGVIPIPVFTYPITLPSPTYSTPRALYTVSPPLTTALGPPTPQVLHQSWRDEDVIETTPRTL